VVAAVQERDLDQIMEIALNENPGLRKAYARLGEADAVAQVEKTTLPSLQQRVSAFEGPAEGKSSQ
jgi:outer membrane protein TolC